MLGLDYLIRQEGQVYIDIAFYVTHSPQPPRRPPVPSAFLYAFFLGFFGPKEDSRRLQKDLLLSFCYSI